jgi:peptidylprolyl isomerase
MKYFGLIGTICIALTLGACGSDSSSDPSTSQSSAETGASEVSSPTEVKIVQASAAEEAANAKPTTPNIQFPNEPLPKDLIVKDVREGSGPPAKPGDEMTIKFICINKTGKIVFNSWDKEGQHTAKFTLGAGTYFPGWDEGVAGMRAGGRREIFFPATVTEQLGAVVYVIDLLSIK